MTLPKSKSYDATNEWYFGVIFVEFEIWNNNVYLTSRNNL